MRVVIGLGANLGDRLATLREAVLHIGRICEVMRRSRVYETAPVGPAQPDFLNAAIAVKWSLDACRVDSGIALLDALGSIEVLFGRERENEVRWGPRTLDLDILWTDGPPVIHPRLSIPHPRLHERAFAIRPLLDVAPDARDPIMRTPYAVPGNQRVILTLFNL